MRKIRTRHIFAATIAGLALHGCQKAPADNPDTIDPAHVDIVEPVSGSDIPMHLMYIETIDGLYAPIGLRKPFGDGPFPVVLLASGNGGEGMAWIRNAVENRGYIMERFLKAGYAVAWLRYRAEVELGYNKGGPLIEDIRQGRQLLNRSPLEYEDEIAIIDYVKTLPYIDPDRVGLLGLSHGGEMILKIVSEYHGVVAAVPSEPAAHEFLAVAPDDSADANEETGLRNLENMQMTGAENVRARIDMDLARRRIATIDTPLLVMGREADHLQGIFRVTYELLDEAGKDVAWTSYDHPLHGYVYPLRGADGAYEVNGVQDAAIREVIAFFDAKMQ